VKELSDFPRAGQLALRLEAAGIDLASVTDVVLIFARARRMGGQMERARRGAT
jgi:hypothetical protein